MNRLLAPSTNSDSAATCRCDTGMCDSRARRRGQHVHRLAARSLPARCLSGTEIGELSTVLRQTLTTTVCRHTLPMDLKVGQSS